MDRQINAIKKPCIVSHVNLSDVKLIIFDADGVLVEDGMAIPGAPEVIDQLRKDREIVVFSNNSTRHPNDVKAGLYSQGIIIDHIITSSVLAADYCKKEGIKTVFLVGEGGLVKILQENGIIINTWSERKIISEEELPDAVIVGMDRTATYDKFAIASQCILKGSRFIATNPDKSFPTPRGLEPGAGSMIAAIVAATEIDPEIILGKPSPLGYELILNKFDVKPNEALMIGDRYETDILGAIRANIPAIIVNTGVAKTRDNPGKYMEHPQVPVIDSLADLLEL